MTEREALERILEISYAGHEAGREARLMMIARYARAGLGQESKEQSTTPSYLYGDRT